MYDSSQCVMCVFFFFQAEDGIRDLVRSRGLGDVYKRQVQATKTGPSNDSSRGGNTFNGLTDIRMTGGGYLNLYYQVNDTYTVSYTHLRAHETVLDLVCRLLLEKKKMTTTDI